MALDDLSNMVLSLPLDVRPELSELIGGEFAPERELPDFDDPDSAIDGEVLSESDFMDQWVMMHTMGGGMISMRTGNACPLGDQAKSEGGRAASSAVYAMCNQNPVTRKLFLNPNMGILGMVAVIFAHGAACVQIVKASRELPAPQSRELAEPEGANYG